MLKSACNTTTATRTTARSRVKSSATTPKRCISMGNADDEEAKRKEAKGQLDERFRDATDRARQLTDSLVRYLATVNAGGIAMMFTLAGLLREDSLAIFLWPTIAFVLGLIFAGSALVIEHHRQDERSNTASRLRTALAHKEMSVKDSMRTWDDVVNRQLKLVWPWTRIFKSNTVRQGWTWTRNATLASSLCFVGGVFSGLWVLAVA